MYIKTILSEVSETSLIKSNTSGDFLVVIFDVC